LTLEEHIAFPQVFKVDPWVFDYSGGEESICQS